MPQNLITLSRTALYELVWSKPVRDVAKDFGMSDVALAKRCRAVRVPIPGRGYWAKVAAGKTPRKTPLPKHRGGRNKAGGRIAFEDRLEAGRRERGYRDVLAPCPTEQSDHRPSDKEADDEPTVTFTPRPAPPPPAPDSPISPEQAALRARIDALEITPLDTLLHAHPAVLRTAVNLKHLKSRDITWPRGTRSGPILQVTNVSEAQLDRALRVLDAVLRASDAMGWHFTAPPPQEPPTYRGRGAWGPTPAAPPIFGHLLVDGEPLQLKIDERRRQFDHVPTDAEKADKKAGRHVWAPRFDFEPSGELRLHLFDVDSSWVRKTWKDTKARPLETQGSKIVHGLLDRALELKRDREEQRLRDLARREHERQQALVRERRAANGALIEALEIQAGAWSRAQALRRYLRAARRALGEETFKVDLQAQRIDFLAWAEHYVNQLDPLHPEPRDPNSPTNARSNTVPTTSARRKNCSASPVTPGSAPPSSSPTPPTPMTTCGGDH